MSGKRDLTRENEIRRLTTIRKNADKVITGYIKTMHPAVYGEAEKYLQDLIAEYPDKRDPSKTKRFKHMLRTKTNSEKHPARNKVVKMDSFRLQIELNDYTKRSNPPAQSSQAETTTSNTPAEVTIQSSQAEATTSSTPAEVTIQSSQAEVTIQSTQAEVTIQSSQAEATTSSTPDPQDASLTVMDEGTLEQILADLREDPTIATFFSDFEHQLDNCPLW